MTGSNGFAEFAVLGVSSVLPDEGPASGGTEITISGTYFSEGAVVRIGGELCTNVVVVSSSSITCTTPSGTPGPADVTVTNEDDSTATFEDLFLFTEEENENQDVPGDTPAPASRPYEGPVNLLHTSNSYQSGTEAVITGERLNTIEAVYVGDKIVPHSLLPDGRLSYSLKDIPAGNYTVRFWVPNSSVNLTAQIKVGNASGSVTTTPGTFTATKLFAGYRGDAGPVVARDLAAITAFIKQYPGITNVTCTGSTSGVPAKSTDQALATARAKNACDAIQKLVPNAKITLATSTGKGVGQRFRSVTVTVSGTR
jgi:hypothetical protein